jgi:hypothetical protein
MSFTVGGHRTPLELGEGSDQAPVRRIYGRADPPLEFLLAASEVMGDEDARYLVQGGPRSGVEVDRTLMVAMASSQATIAMGDIFRVSGAGFDEATGTGFGLPDLSGTVAKALQVAMPDEPPPWASGGLVEVWHSLVGSGMEPSTAAQAIGRALREPLKALGIEARDLDNVGALDLYIFAIIPALLLAAREHPSK